MKSFKLKTRTTTYHLLQHYVVVVILNFCLEASDVGEHAGRQSVKTFGADRTVGVNERKRAGVEGHTVRIVAWFLDCVW